MNNERLKPCPFCGKAATLYSEQQRDDLARWQVGCFMSMDCPGYYMRGVVGYGNDGRTAIVERWNNRA